MTEEPKAEGSIAEELDRFGHQVAEAVRTAWESEDRRKLQEEIAQGLQQFGDQVSEALRKASESETAQQLREQTEKVVAEAKESHAADEIRKGIISGLDVLNRELGKLVVRLEANKPVATTEEDASAEEAPVDAVDASPSEDTAG